MKDYITKNLRDKKLENAFSQVFSVDNRVYSVRDSLIAEDENERLEATTTIKARLGAMLLSMSEPNLFNMKSLFVSVFFSMGFSDGNILLWLLTVLFVWSAISVGKFFVDNLTVPLSTGDKLQQKYRVLIAPYAGHNENDDNISNVDFGSLFLEQNSKKYYGSFMILIGLLSVSAISMKSLVLFFIPFVLFKVISYVMVACSAALLRDSHEMILNPAYCFFYDVIWGVPIRSKENSERLNTTFGLRHRKKANSQ